MRAIFGVDKSVRNLSRNPGRVGAIRQCGNSRPDSDNLLTFLRSLWYAFCNPSRHERWSSDRTRIHIRMRGRSFRSGGLGIGCHRRWIGRHHEPGFGGFGGQLSIQLASVHRSAGPEVRGESWGREASRCGFRSILREAGSGRRHELVDSSVGVEAQSRGDNGRASRRARCSKRLSGGKEGRGRCFQGYRASTRKPKG